MSNETPSRAMMPPNRTVTPRTLRMDTWLSAQGVGLPLSAQSICEGWVLEKPERPEASGPRARASSAHRECHRVSHDAVDDQRGTEDAGSREPTIVAGPDTREDLDGCAKQGLEILHARLDGLPFRLSP